MITTQRGLTALVEILIDADPDTWMAAGYSNNVIVTQVDDGASNGEGHYTSSARCRAPIGDDSFFVDSEFTAPVTAHAGLR